MKLFSWLIFGVLYSSSFVSGHAQSDAWRELVVLESDRFAAEGLLGRSRDYFATYGIYDTKFAVFHVWYSTGECRKDVEGLQYKVPANRIIGMHIYPKNALPVDSYISDLSKFEKSKSFISDDRKLYTSFDEVIAYETIVPKSGASEFVYSISIQPGRDSKHLLCKQR